MAANGMHISGVHTLHHARHMLAVVCGLGMGVMAALFLIINVIADFWGNGTVGLPATIPEVADRFDVKLFAKDEKFPVRFSGSWYSEDGGFYFRIPGSSLSSIFFKILGLLTLVVKTPLSLLCLLKLYVLAHNKLHQKDKIISSQGLTEHRLFSHSAISHTVFCEEISEAFLNFLACILLKK